MKFFLICLGYCFLLQANPNASCINHGVSYSVGAFNVHRSDKDVVYQFEYYYPYRYKKMHFFSGIMLNNHNAAYFFTGFGWRVFMLETFYVFPTFAPGLYYRGESKDLGLPLQFRSCLGFGWRIAKGLTLGGELFHLSNAGLSSHNPGTNCLVLTLSFSLN